MNKGTLCTNSHYLNVALISSIRNNSKSKSEITKTERKNVSRVRCSELLNETHVHVNLVVSALLLWLLFAISVMSVHGIVFEIFFEPITMTTLHIGN